MKFTKVAIKLTFRTCKLLKPLYRHSGTRVASLVRYEADDMKNTTDHQPERRSKSRFAMRRELRYRALDEERIAATGYGFTTDISSGGVAFRADQTLSRGGFIELSVSWPAMLDDICPMRLVVYGRLIRASEGLAVCTVEKYEFRTQPRKWAERPGVARNDTMLQRWVEGLRKVECVRNSARLAAMHA